ncbi:MAG: hypothetical protein ACREOK_04140 [Gemmatimonadaceae bacterium]
MMLVASLGLLAQMAVVPAGDAPSDQDVIRDARSAQIRFERHRRANLPRKPGGSMGRPCDALVGRFCYWYDSTESDAEPEPERIVEARLHLLATLDSAARLTPDDPWIAGQRVRYHLEADSSDAALRASGECRADGWWCAALTGLVHHVAQEYLAADSAFTVALRTMPPRQRCEWLDLSVITDGRGSRAFRDAPCDARERMADSTFTAAQPLWMIQGNDLRSEYVARLTMARIHDRSANAYGTVFGDDNRELMLRYGWSEWFTRHELPLSSFPNFAVTGHSRSPSYHFVPPADKVTGASEESLRRLSESRARTRYAPRHIERLTRLSHQLARFPRGDSMLIVAAVAPVDTILARDRWRAALAVRRGDSVSVIASTRGRSLAGWVANDTMIVSVEALGDSTRRAARSRYTIDPVDCSSWCLSDLLVVDAARVDRTATPEDAVRAALTELRVQPGTSIGVYFELAPAVAQGARPSAAATVTLTMTPVHVGLLRRAAARLRLADRPEAVRMRWQAVVEGSPQLVAIDVPASASGRYLMQLTITPRGAASISASREIEIAR